MFPVREGDQWQTDVQFSLGSSSAEFRHGWTNALSSVALSASVFPGTNALMPCRRTARQARLSVSASSATTRSMKCTSAARPSRFGSEHRKRIRSSDRPGSSAPVVWGRTEVVRHQLNHQILDGKVVLQHRHHGAVGQQSAGGQGAVEPNGWSAAQRLSQLVHDRAPGFPRRRDVSCPFVSLRGPARYGADQSVARGERGRFPRVVFSRCRRVRSGPAGAVPRGGAVRVVTNRWRAGRSCSPAHRCANRCSSGSDSRSALVSQSSADCGTTFSRPAVLRRDLRWPHVNIGITPERRVTAPPGGGGDDADRDVAPTGRVDRRSALLRPADPPFRWDVASATSWWRWRCG